MSERAAFPQSRSPNSEVVFWRQKHLTSFKSQLSHKVSAAVLIKFHFVYAPTQRYGLGSNAQHLTSFSSALDHQNVARFAALTIGVTIFEPTISSNQGSSRKPYVDSYPRWSHNYKTLALATLKKYHRCRFFQQLTTKWYSQPILLTRQQDSIMKSRGHRIIQSNNEDGNCFIREYGKYLSCTWIATMLYLNGENRKTMKSCRWTWKDTINFQI